jgi:chromosome segregation ATPase
MGNNMAQENNAIVKMLLENLTASLTQMVVKYEAISKDCGRIEEKTDSLHSQMHDVKEIKEIASGIRAQCEQNLQAVNKILSVLTDARVDIEDLLAKTSSDHTSQNDKLSKIIKDIENLNDNVSGVGNKVEEVKTKMAPVAKTAKILSTPMGIALFIFGLMAAMFVVQEMASKTWDLFSKKPSAGIEKWHDGTNDVDRIPGRRP